MLQNRKGFTLIELLVVIGIVGILLSITIVAINPGRQFRLANDTNRASGLNNLSSALTQLIIDNRGSIPTVAGPFDLTSLSTTTSVRISSGVSGMVSLCQMLTGASSIGSLLSKSTYITKLPFDPTTGSYTDCSTFNTGYSLTISAGRVAISGLGEEPAVTMQVTR